MERKEVNLITLLQVVIFEQTGEWITPEQATYILKNGMKKEEQQA